MLGLEEMITLCTINASVRICCRCFLDFLWTSNCWGPERNRLQSLQCDITLGFFSFTFLTGSGFASIRGDVGQLVGVGEAGGDLWGVIALVGILPPCPSLSTAEPSMKVFLGRSGWLRKDGVNLAWSRRRCLTILRASYSTQIYSFVGDSGEVARFWDEWSQDPKDWSEWWEPLAPLS